MRRITAFLAVALLLGFAAPLSAAEATPAPRLRWHSCYSDVAPNLECATFRVPLDYDRPRGQKISLALIRIPAGDPERRIGSLFFNPGGPGTSGVDKVLGAAGSDDLPYSDEVRARFDLVGFDPRGIHQSTPLLCFRSLEQALRIVPPVPFPVTAEEEAMFERADRALNRACQRRGDPIINHMATADVARDLDLLRQAVGDRQLTYAGYSYGSFLGITYANLFPRRVRALALDSVVDPIAWTTGRGDEAGTQPVYNRLGNPAGAQATLEEFFRLCDAAGPDGCAFAGNSESRFAAIAERLRSEPLEYVDPVTGETVIFTYSHLIKMTWDAMNTASTWPGLAEFLAELEAALVPAAETGALDALEEDTRPRPTTPPYPNIVEGQYGVLCSDSDNPDDHRFWSTAGAEADRRFGYFGRMWTWFSSPCAVWEGFDADRYTGPFDRNTANPVLLVGIRFDPAAAYENAVVVDDLMPNSTLLTVEGWGHTSGEIPSQCTEDVVSRYLLTRITPADRATCAVDFGPFDVP
jgi:pimeloyl-ACP methyl ester carboxylesterase